jgi:hypothetical protein
LARRVFISFRFSDGAEYKEELCKLFDQDDDVIDCSEDEDRSGMSEETIRRYLYDKLARTSVTIVLLTPEAIEYRRDRFDKIDDWMYDELRYSLEDRDNNVTNGVVAVYTSEAKDLLIEECTHKCDMCREESRVTGLKDVNNLARKNMLNIKESHKKHQCVGVYDRLEDSYVSLISFEDFKSDVNKYIENAVSKRERRNEFNLVKRMD